MSKMPLNATILCVVCAEMVAMTHELTRGPSDYTRKLWEAAGKVRKHADIPRVKNHRAYIVAQLRQYAVPVRMP